MTPFNYLYNGHASYRVYPNRHIGTAYGVFLEQLHRQEGTESIHPFELLYRQELSDLFYQAHVFLGVLVLGGSGVRVITLAVISCLLTILMKVFSILSPVSIRSTSM